MELKTEEIIIDEDKPKIYSSTIRNPKFEREVIVKFHVTDFIRVQKLIENDQKKRDYNRNYARTNNGSQKTRKSRVQPVQYEVIEKY